MTSHWPKVDVRGHVFNAEGLVTLANVYVNGKFSFSLPCEDNPVSPETLDSIAYKIRRGYIRG